MKILIFGKGWIGSRMAQTWHGEAVLSDVRIDDKSGVLAEIEKHAPDVVVNAAGKAGTPNVDWCETHQVETMRSNTIGALILAEACQEKQVYLLHLGTGCVFYGQHNPETDAPWSEDSHANPEAFYTRTKYATELILSRLPNVGIVRFRMPIDHIPSSKNLIDKLVRYTKVIDVENSVTVLEDLVSVCHQLLEKRGVGLFHAVNPGTMRHRDLLGLYQKYVDPAFSCEWIAEEELVKQGLATKKRSNNFMSSQRLAELGIVMRPIQEAIDDTMQKYAALKRVQQFEGKWDFHLVPAQHEMKGVITAGGKGTRLMPLTSITNKHLLPIFNQPMILYPLKTLIKAGIKEIMIVMGPEYAHQFIKLLGSGAEYGCQLSYRIQDASGGIAQALSLAEDFVGQHPCFTILGDNIFEEDFREDVHTFTGGAKTFFKAVDRPEQYGVIELDPTTKQVLSIEEKPKQPKSNYAQLGAYMYDASVFDKIRSLKPSARGELEISELNALYLAQGHMTAREIQGRWFDAGTFRDLHLASEYFSNINSPSSKA
ncbi:MAG: RmlD sub bind protein [Patescibacteria group bacterium]|nr:RmlD sub bind protein [Patescibacteria group bacterium]